MLSFQDQLIEGAMADKSKKSGISVATLRKVYNRGVAAWKTGHRPGTTPQQWGHARVNSYINKGKTYHTADKDLREDVNAIFETEFMDCCPNVDEAIDATPTLSTTPSKKKKFYQST